ncbi:MAG: AAA-like domain-containing protein [Dolichospermum sp.]
MVLPSGCTCVAVWPCSRCIRAIVTSFTPVQLDPIETFQLYSIGLVIKKDNKVEPRCQLYREYFTTFL